MLPSAAVAEWEVDADGSPYPGASPTPALVSLPPAPEPEPEREPDGTIGAKPVAWPSFFVHRYSRQLKRDVLATQASTIILEGTSAHSFGVGVCPAFSPIAIYPLPEMCDRY